MATIITHLKDGFRLFIDEWQRFALYTLLFMIIPYALLFFVPLIHAAISSLLLLLGAIGFQTSIIWFASKRLRRKKANHKAVLKHTLGRYVHVAITIVIVSLLAAAILLPGMALSFIGGIEQINPYPVLIAGIILFFVSVFLVFAPAIATLTEKNAFLAIKESFLLLKRNYWMNAGYFLILQVVNLILMSIINILGTQLPATAGTAFIISLVQTYIAIPVIIAIVQWYHDKSKNKTRKSS